MRGLRRRSRGGACVAALGSDGCFPEGWPALVEVTTVFFSSISSFLRQSGGGTVHDLQDLAAYILQGGSVDVDPVEAVGELREIELFFQPHRKIVGVELEPEPGFDEMVMNAVHTNPVQAVSKFSQVPRHKGSRNHDGIGRAKIKRLQRGAVAGARIAVEVRLNNISQALTQCGQRRELAHIGRSQPLRQSDLVARRERPVRKIVGETFPDEMVFLERAERMLKDGGFGTGAQGVEEFRQVRGLLPLNTEQMSRRVEVEGRSRPAFCWRG